MYKLVNHNLRTCLVFFLVSDFLVLYMVRAMFIMDQWPIFSGGVSLERSSFFLFTNDQNGPQRHLRGFGTRGLSPCIRFAAVDTAVSPAGSWALEALDVWAERNTRVRKWRGGERCSLKALMHCLVQDLPLCLLSRSRRLRATGAVVMPGAEQSRAACNPRKVHLLHSSLPFWRDSVHLHLYSFAHCPHSG